MRLTEIYKTSGWFSRVTHLVQKLFDKNAKSPFPNNLKWNFTPFPSPDHKNSSANRKSVLNLTKVDSFENLVTLFNL